MASGTRTAKVEKHPNIIKFVGGAKELLPSELPTLRDCFQYSLLAEERSATPNLSNRDKFKEVAQAVRAIWFNAHPLLPLQTERYIIDRLVKQWTSAKNLTREHSNKTLRDDFLKRLDRLFDILRCQCVIRPCADSSCDGCSDKAHVACNCKNKRDVKIPTQELNFIMVQRSKVGSKSHLQMGRVDVKVSKKVATNLKRKASRNAALNVKRGKLGSAKSQPATAKASSSGTSDAAASQSAGSEYESPGDSAPMSYNTMDVTKISAAAIRYGVSNRATAAIGTATLAAAKDANMLRDDISDEPVIDQNKIKRAKSKHMKTLREETRQVLIESGILGILFDGRKDSTKTLTRGDDGKLHPSEVEEEHYSICGAPGGEYLTHLTLDPEDRQGRKPAEHLAALVHEWLEDHQLEESLLAIGGDSTNMITGWKGGAIAHLEKMMGRKLIWLICSLHTNELPLRHLMVKVDGGTSGNNTFKGPIGKLIPKVLEFPAVEAIPPIDINIDLIPMEEHILKDLSADQKYLYDITSAIKSGHMSVDLRCKKIGPHNHARWLNLANRLCRLWCSHHALDEATTANLKQLVQFVVAVYAPMWFRIKRDKKWFHGPGHILKQLELVRQLDESIRDKVIEHVKNTAWDAHPELLLQAMLVSEDFQVRDFAVQKIVQIRAANNTADCPTPGTSSSSTGENATVRPFNMPEINVDATKLEDLIDWSTVPLYEPLLTSHLSHNQLIELVMNKMDVPDFPVHGQSIERCVQGVTRASASVYGHEARDGFIKATLHHRQLLSTNDSKKDLMVLFD